MKLPLDSAIIEKIYQMKKRNPIESGSQYFTDDALISYYNETKKTIQDYVEAIARHCNYKSIVSQTSDGTVLDDRARLIDLYDACFFQDAHLRACMATLDSYLTGERYSLGYYDKNGKWIIDRGESKKVEGSQFNNAIKGILESLSYGYTLLYINEDIDPETGLLKEISTVERRNILPSQRRVIQRQHQWTPGWDLDAEQYSHNYVLIDSGDLGMYASTTPLVLAKKYTVSNWVNFAHTYGQPIIHGKTTATDNNSRKRLAQEIVNAAQNKVIVTGTDDTIDIKTFTMSNSEKIYESLIKNHANSEMSNLILGSESMAGGMQSYVGSTQAHEGIFRSRVKNYRLYVENMVNEKILPVLRYWGYIKPGLIFKYNNQVDMSMEDKIKLFDVLTNKYEVGKEVIDKEFGVEVGEQKNLQSYSSASTVGGSDGDDVTIRMSDEEYEKRYGHPRSTSARVNFLRGISK